MLSDGVYEVEFDTDSSMFRINETLDGKGTLTAADGIMTIHITLGSKNIVNLYPGLAEDAKEDGANLLHPTLDSVTYPDGWTEEVYGFDVPVPVLDEEFNLALIGKKGKWYDHKVRVFNPVLLDNQTMPAAEENVLEDGSYTVELTLEGGSGKAEILSPVMLTVSDNEIMAALRWNSPNYDYMIVNDEKFLPVNESGNSVFEIPVPAFDEPVEIIGDTVAMSKPHEVEYTLIFHSNTIKSSESVNTESQQGSEQELVYESSMKLQYAEHFSVDYYEGGYALLTTTDGTRILTIPEGKEVPEHLEEDVITLKQPVENLYLVASGAMDMFSELDALDAVRLSGQKAESWYVDKAREAMEAGQILYAGKYSKPDYERIVAENCTMAIQNRMITHAPEVIEKLESFGVPVMIDYSTYEKHPMGRVEWIRFFGALLGKEEQAEAIYSEQIEILERVSAEEKTDKTAAFFFITSDGLVQVRRPSDYVPKMIELAGGNYIFDTIGEEDSARSTVNIQMEEFYDTAKDADYLIYNSSIDGGVRTLEELMDKSKLFADFKAVQEGNVWCTTNDMYQQSMSIGYLIEDMHRMFMDKEGNEHEMKYLFRVQ